MSDPVREGGCLCGAVRYVAAGNGFHATLCHCRSCRLASGAPSVAWVSFAAAGFRHTGAAPATYRSSAHATREFCARCGTALAYRHDAHADEVDVAIATLDDPAEFAPADHSFVREKLDWVSIEDGRERFDTTRPEW